MKTSEKLRKAAILKRYGIKRPLKTVEAALKANLPIGIAAAVLEKESYGGKNVFGSDPSRCSNPGYKKGGRVTKDTYLAYKKLRPSCGMQGVGPVQLTYYSFQDEADSLGGCWKPEINMYVGFKLMKSLIDTHGLALGIERYNGSGPAAQAYSQWVRDRALVWRKRLQS